MNSKPIYIKDHCRQSRRLSLIEAIVNVAVGLVLSLLIQTGMFWLLDIHVTLEQNIGLVTVLTVVSVARSYCLRRLFNMIREA